MYYFLDIFLIFFWLNIILNEELLNGYEELLNGNGIKKILCSIDIRC